MPPKVRHIKSKSGEFDTLHYKFPKQWNLSDLKWAVRRSTLISISDDKRANRKIYATRHTKYFVILDFSETDFPEGSESYRSKEFLSDMYHPLDIGDYAIKVVIFVPPTEAHYITFKRLLENLISKFADKPHLVAKSLDIARSMIDKIIDANNHSKEN